MSLDSLLNQTLTLKANSASRNSQGEYIDSWSGTTSIPARVQPVSGGDESFEFGKKTVRASHKVFCRTTTTITERNRFAFGSRTLAILRVRNIDEMNHHYEIDCLEIL